MYFSAGDGSGVLSPSDNPYAIAVGGTTLGIGHHLNRLFETGWSTGESFLLLHHGWVFLGEQGATGGGPSLLWAQPGYQQGVVPAELATAPGNRGGLVRSAPDISADADPFTGMAVGLLSPAREQAARLHPDRHRRYQRGGAAGGRHRGRRAAGPAALVRVHRPGAVPAGRDGRAARPAADHQAHSG